MQRGWALQMPAGLRGEVAGREQTGTETQKSKPLEMKGPAKVGEVGGGGLGEMEVREGEVGR